MTLIESQRPGSECPDEMLWHAWADDRDDSLTEAERLAVDDHIASCSACQTQADELKRFRTLLLRTRVPTLDEQQWDALETRVEMLAGEPPPMGGRMASRVYWGVAIAAAISLFAVGGWQLLRDRGDGPTTSLSPAGQARVAGAFAPLQIASAEGGLQVAAADGQYRPLRNGDRLERGAQIESSTEGRVVVANNFELRMAANSSVRVLAGNKREVFLRLRHGEIGCRVDKRTLGQRFGVLAGRFRTSVVGTEFTVRHDDAGRVSVMVSQGAVRVDEADDPWRKTSETMSVVRAGNRWRFAAGHMDMGPIATDEVEPARPSQRRAAPVDPMGTSHANGQPAAGGRDGAVDRNGDARRQAAAPTEAAAGYSASQRARSPRARRAAGANAGATAARASRNAAATTPRGVKRSTQTGAASAPTAAASPAAKPTAAAGSPQGGLALPPPLPEAALPPAPVHSHDAPANAKAGEAKAGAVAKKGGADATKTDTDPSVQRRILINLPPQAMTPEEIERAKANEARRRGHGRSLNRDTAR